MRILIIDSSILILDRWQQLLNEQDFVSLVAAASSYQEGIRLLDKINPDVVLLDSTLPRQDWILLLKEIKSRNKTKTVIVFSSGKNDHIQKISSTYGADFVFDKYHDFEKIPVILRSISQEINEKQSR
jgi:chemotaxis response regulator CheB